MALLSDDPAVAGVLALLDEQTTLLLAGARELDDAALRQPSHLPGWSRGHVLTHLARNADALTGVVTDAAAGRQGRMYPSRQARDADIDVGAERPADQIGLDLATSADRFRVAVAALPVQGADTTFTSPAGWWRPARDVPWLRCREVVLHHVDLGTGFTLEQAPTVALRLLLETVDAFAQRQDVPGLDLEATDLRRTWRLRGGGPRATGPATALAAWLTGRDPDGTGLTGDVPLPALPPWA